MNMSVMALLAAIGAGIALPLAAVEFHQRRVRRRETKRGYRRKERIQL
ncbi:MAG TPA: hypothetical protein VGB65_01565 [Allosphingosinicella sp.]|jgi:hypothetical protein